MKKYFKIWFRWSQAVFATVLGTYKLSGFLFILGKVARFLFFLLAILIFVGKTKVLVGYSLNQVVLFFLVFNFVDILTQFLFRGVYWFRWKLISGRFDYALLKPINPLFDVLCSHPDLLDLITLIFLSIFMAVFISKNSLVLSPLSGVLFFLLLVNAFILALSLHIIVAGFGIITLEVDNIIWIYRDITKMGRIPVDIYAPLLRGLLTFAVPVGVMMNFPAKALMGFLSWQGALFSFIVSGIFLFGSLKFWQYALAQYSSASS